MDRPDLLQALDQAIAAVLRLEATGLRTAQGGSASGELERLRAELAARRAEVAAGASLDRDWAGRTVRWVTGWLYSGARLRSSVRSGCLPVAAGRRWRCPSGSSAIRGCG